MAGLVLRSGVSGSASAKLGASTGNYAPMAPAASTAAGSGASNIGSLAYGISGDGTSPGGKCAGIGSTIVGAVATALLAYIWYTLPR